MTFPMMLLAVLVAAPQPSATSSQPDAEAAPAIESSGSAQAAIDAGLKAFKSRRFTQAEGEFRKAVEADPQSAGAHFYLGYTYYKMAEPTLRNTPDKQKALSLFAKAFELDPAFRPVWGTKQK